MDLTAVFRLHLITQSKRIQTKTWKRRLWAWNNNLNEKKNRHFSIGGDRPRRNDGFLRSERLIIWDGSGASKGSGRCIKYDHEGFRGNVKLYDKYFKIKPRQTCRLHSCRRIFKRLLCVCVYSETLWHSPGPLAKWWQSCLWSRWLVWCRHLRTCRTTLHYSARSGSAGCNRGTVFCDRGERLKVKNSRLQPWYVSCQYKSVNNWNQFYILDNLEPPPSIFNVYTITF